MTAMKQPLLTALSSALLMLLSQPSQAATVNNGYDPEAVLKGGVRYRHMNSMGMGQREVYIGNYPVTIAANRNTADISWGSGKHIKFVYDAANTLLTTVVGAGSGTVTVNKNVGDLGELNYLMLTVQRNGHPPMPSVVNEIYLQNATLNGAPLAINSFQGLPSGAKWNVTGENLTGGFVLEGDIVLTGMQPGSDNNHIEISAGYSDQTGPKILDINVQPNPAIVNGNTTLRATVSDTDAGNHNIVSAEYSLNNGSWQSMAAQDGTFDSVSEDVETVLPGGQLGSNEVCIRGADSKGNVTTPPTCTTFMVTYQFDGFFEPVNTGLVNNAKAGQAIPAKWRISDANGLGIDDAASFAGLYSYPVDCLTQEGNASDAIEEYAAGESGLISHGDGNWQFNWKTPKTYANSCRAMYVEFNSGAISPIVVFKFK